MNYRVKKTDLFPFASSKGFKDWLWTDDGDGFAKVAGEIRPERMAEWLLIAQPL